MQCRWPRSSFSFLRKQTPAHSTLQEPQLDDACRIFVQANVHAQVEGGVPCHLWGSGCMHLASYLCLARQFAGIAHYGRATFPASSAMRCVTAPLGSVGKEKAEHTEAAVASYKAVHIDRLGRRSQHVHFTLHSHFCAHGPISASPCEPQEAPTFQQLDKD